VKATTPRILQQLTPGGVLGWPALATSPASWDSGYWSDVQRPNRAGWALLICGGLRRAAGARRPGLPRQRPSAGAGPRRRLRRRLDL